MSENTQYIVNLCHTLLKEGKTPSLAMIRNRSERQLSIPEVMHVLKRWKTDSQSLVKISTENSSSMIEKSSSLEERVNVLEAEIAELKMLVTKLTENARN